ncbi:MAG: hypothetical protein DRJ01_10385 [Bacteroidetes bacterium]|nr:MAG: hypothetical protein DRJ01_10385 [Bacteroidota bacterium]
MNLKIYNYNKIGQFHLIDKGIFGEEIQYYVSKNSEDESFKLLNDSIDELSIILGSYKKDWDVIKIKKNRIKTLRKKMSENIVQIRLKKIR